MTSTTLAAVAQAAAGTGAGNDPAPVPVTPKPITAESLKSDHPEIFAAIRDEGFAAGVSAENTRILAIEANALDGHEELVANHKADTTVTAEQSAMAILAAEKAKPASPRAVLERMDKAAEGVESRPSESGDGGAPVQKATTPDGWKAEYEASKDLQAEYPTVDAYVATKKREAASAAA